MTPKTHEIKLKQSKFNELISNGYIVLEINDIAKNDYILFKQVVTLGDENVETGLFQMTQVTNVITEGLQEKYLLLFINKL